MIRSYRTWSAVMGAWYLVAVASLLVHPPGSETRVVVDHGRATVPEHRTFFQNGTSADLTAALFAALGVALLACSAVSSRHLRVVHLAGLIWCYVFGIGYVTAALLLEQPWLAGGFVLVASAAHLLIGKLRDAAVIAASLDGGAA